MSTEIRHKRCEAVPGSYAETYDEGRPGERDEVLHPEHTIDGALGAPEPLGSAAYERGAGRIRCAFPDLTFVPAGVDAP